MAGNPDALPSARETPAWPLMRTLLTILLVLAMLAVLGTLFAGIAGLVRGNGDALRSNRLMRWRVVLQALALALFAALMLALRG
jgi:hypothetical protein